MVALFVMSSAVLAQTQTAPAPAKAAPATAASPDMIAKGKALVMHGMCHDCHTPKTFGPKGMGFDFSKSLSGYPSGQPLPPMDKKALTPGYWVLGSPDLMGWVGPWGVSYAANLTPDPQTGIGLWTPEVFISAVRTGKHMGAGRPILPPMPWNFVADMSDEQLREIFAYLKSLPPIKNAVPQPVAPPDVK
jgi:cytochrome c553